MRLVSQPSLTEPLQLAQPLVQLMTAHVPLAHVALALAGAHTDPHAPQLVVVFNRVSQPFAALPSQSPKPGLQRAIAHTPAVHIPVALAGLHARPHAPQWVSEVLRSVSQALFGIPSQFPQPAVQAVKLQCPPVQTVLALSSLHSVPHAPQWVSEVLRSVSHPSLATLLQLPRPIVHEATSHTPAGHRAVAFESEHAAPQAPQLVGLCRSVSQPSPRTPSPGVALQSPQPVGQF